MGERGVFSSLIFLLLVLLSVSMANGLPSSSFPLTSVKALFVGLGFYLGILALIYWQKKICVLKWRYRSSTMLTVTNIELLIFLIFFYFILGGQRIFNELPFLGSLQMIPILFGLGLYFGGLAAYHCTGESKRTQDQTYLQRVLFIIPFAVPFLFFTIIVDLFYIPVKHLAPAFFKFLNTPLGTLVFFIMSLLFVGLCLIFLPPLIIWIWGCQPLPNTPIKARLEQLCRRAHFRHAGFRTWDVMNHTLTAAILGVLPRLRYVIFTPKLLRDLPPEEVEAILAHEIGHSYYKHLWLFPLIILGLVICTALFAAIFTEPIIHLFDFLSMRYPSAIWPLLYPLALFLPILMIFILYLRYVFGLFSRLFEREADLHGFNLGIPPEHMIGALNSIAVATGYSHRVPNWHHYSIQQRIDFLQQAAIHPELIAQHHRRVKRYLWGYLAIFGLGMACLFILF